jgi:AcrR family transcriptional regulator
MAARAGDGETELTRGQAVPKLGMGPIRREQICRAAAAVIAREGFAGSTMRMVAEEAGVSTGMINHYFANRQDLLTQALVFVSERTQDRYREAIEGVPPGIERLHALLDSALSDDERMRETWYVWINAYGEAVRLPGLRHTMEERLRSWYDIIDMALEEVAPPAVKGAIPWSWRLDAMLNGLSIQALTSEAQLDSRLIRDEIVRSLFGDLAAGSELGSGRDARVSAGR